MNNRITLFIASLNSGGAEHQLTILANMLADCGYIVELVTYSDLPDHYVLSKNVKRVRIAEGKPKWWKLISIWYFFLFHKVDCVISFGARDNMLSLLPLLLRPRLRMIAGERCVTYQHLTWYKKMNYHWLYHRATFVVTNSFSQQDDIKKNWPQLARKLRTIINYTDLNKYSPTAMPHNTIIKVGIFCRYAEQKNYRRFASVVKCLKEESDRIFEIHWYGNMHKGNGLLPQYVELDGLVHKLHIGDCLILHDHTQDVASLLPDFDVLCLPSLTEGFSNSISEYICSARPVLASDVADNHLMVHHGRNGYLFNPEIEESMVAAFKRYFSLTATEQTVMGLQSRQIAEGLFRSESFIKSYINLIEDEESNITSINTP